MTISREMLCSDRQELTVTGTGHTPAYDEAIEAEEQPEGAHHEYAYVLLAFDDTIEEAHVQRNSVYLKLTPSEAASYEVGKTYTLSIG